VVVVVVVGVVVGVVVADERFGQSVDSGVAGWAKRDAPSLIPRRRGRPSGRLWLIRALRSGTVMPDDVPEVGRLSAFPEERRPLSSSSARVRLLAPGLGRVAAALEIVAIVAAVVGFLVGIVLIFMTRNDYDSSHPYAGLGFGMAATSVVGGMFNWCVARALRLFAEHTASVHAAGRPPH
jgi:hypothetical protein